MGNIRFVVDKESDLMKSNIAHGDIESFVNTHEWQTAPALINKCHTVDFYKSESIPIGEDGDGVVNLTYHHSFVDCYDDTSEAEKGALVLKTIENEGYPWKRILL